jgi:hypothetical protein
VKKTILALAACALCLAAAPALEKELAPETTAILGFGESEVELGGDFEGGESWFPLLFALGGEGNIHVPDFYKDRFAIYCSDGAFLRAVPSPIAISPDLRSFRIAPDGAYVFFQAPFIVRVEADGSAFSRYELPMGSLPTAFMSTDAGIFLTLPTIKGSISYRFGLRLEGDPVECFYELGPYKRPCVENLKGEKVLSELYSYKVAFPERFAGAEASPDSRFSLAAQLPGRGWLWCDWGKRRTLVLVSGPDPWESRAFGLYYSGRRMGGYSCVSSNGADLVAVGYAAEGKLVIDSYRLPR